MGDASDDHPGDLDALVRRVDPDRWIASRFIGEADKRADVVALYAFDHELARAPKVSTNPLIGEIRLTWWREALDEIFEGRAVRRHPAAEALAAAVSRRGLVREPLERLIEARYRELDPQPLDEAEALAWAQGTGGTAAGLAARMLDPAADTQGAEAAGCAWALGRRAAASPELKPLLDRQLAAARTAVRTLSAQAFPAAAHAALARRPDRSELGKRLRVTLAVALGRI
ncbi:MAG TPA: squalene/phytoene synthase family protein [Phenylobacterium sp.]|jgi:phytoene synthase|nr:squalene/phytoene synthase family protein [Phenylobacterium sp.]